MELTIEHIIIMALVVIIVIQAFATRNMLPVPIVLGIIDYLEQQAKKTESTLDDNLLKGARDLLNAAKSDGNEAGS